MITAVFDTNVLASGFAGYQALTSPPAQLIRLWRSRAIGLIISEPISVGFTCTLRKP